MAITVRASMLSLLAAVTPAMAGDVLYSQPNDRPGQPSFFSDAVAGQFFSQRTADDFVLTGNATLTAVRFWGGSQNFQFSNLQNMDSFTISIYADNAGSVGDEIASTTLSTEAISTVDTGLTNLGGGIVYEHEASIAPTALGAGRYWVSVGATLFNPGADAWVWAGSTEGNLINATDFFNGNGFVTFDPTFNDLAFEIVGVPTPGSIAVVGLGGLFATSRRRG
jgi:hypothetical protein